MNRSILIVICDFLLVSLLAFSTVDINKTSDEHAQSSLSLNINTNQVVDTGKDLSAVMRLALDEERKHRDQLAGELAQAREAAGQREVQVQGIQKQLQTREQEAQRLQQQQADLDRRQAELQQRYTAAETNLQTLSQQLKSSSAEALLSKEKLAAMEAEARKKTQEAEALQKQLALLAQSNQMVLSEKQQLANQLQLAQVEKRHASEQVVKMQEEVKVEREEKAKLAEGVKVLASRSGELAQEVRENRPLTPNNIFNEFVSNRVDASFVASRSGLLGVDASKRKQTTSVLVTNGTNIFALCHVQDTPLTLWNPGVSWESLTGSLSRNSAAFPIRELSFSQIDPRIVTMPVSSIEARQLGGKVYRLSSDPFKFQDAVLVGAREGYYGECRFEIDLTTPDYFKLDHSFLKGLFGKFNPTRGDLVFSKNGELLGIMANGSYCLRIQGLNTAASIRFGPDVRDQNTGSILSQLYMRVFQLPPKLQ
jgi:hypothetical protein